MGSEGTVVACLEPNAPEEASRRTLDELKVDLGPDARYRSHRRSFIRPRLDGPSAEMPSHPAKLLGPCKRPARARSNDGRQPLDLDVLRSPRKALEPIVALQERSR